MKKDNFLHYIALVSEIGLAIGISTIMGLLLGLWLDGKFGTGVLFSISFLIIGLGGGFIASFRLINELEKRDRRDKADRNTAS